MGLTLYDTYSICTVRSLSIMITPNTEKNAFQQKPKIFFGSYRYHLCKYRDKILGI